MTIAELLLPEFDQELATTRRVLDRVPDSRFVWKLVHHRAQLGVYLRLSNIPVPAMYGPSADEA